MIIAIPVLLLGGLVAVRVIRSGDLFIRYDHVPDGQSWQAFYRQRQAERRGRQLPPVSFIMIGLGLGLVVVMLLFHLL